MRKYWETPQIKNIPEFYMDMEKQPHILIGGTTGAGKSVALNGFIFNLLGNAPSQTELVLIDPKGVELVDYKELPHTLGHFVEMEEIERAIFCVGAEMDRRFKEMAEKGIKKSLAPDLYVIIDEYVDIKLLGSSKTIRELARISAKGRASKVHIVLCTQRPTRDVIDGTIKANFTTVLALRTHNAQESRNLIGVRGCEDLPLHGEAYYDTPSVKGLVKVKIPFVSEETIKTIVNYWIKQKEEVMG